MGEPVHYDTEAFRYWSFQRSAISFGGTVVSIRLDPPPPWSSFPHGAQSIVAELLGQ
jgi:hypothetical protein